MSNITNKIIKNATWGKTILSAVLFLTFLLLINVSGIGVAGLLRITDGVNILDFEFGYTYEQAYDILTAMGAEGRSFYLTRIVPLDFPFPFSYMLFYTGCIAILIKKSACNITSIHRYIFLVPLLAMIFDWIENIGIIVMLNNYPYLPGWAVILSSISGMFKMVFIVLNIVVIGILLVISVFSSKNRRAV